MSLNIVSNTNGRLITLRPQKPRTIGDAVELAVRMEQDGVPPETFWFRLPARCQKHVTDSLDPFVLGVIFIAMSRGADLHVQGRVSPSLLKNLDEFQNAWQVWRPEVYRRVNIHADCETEEPRAITGEAVQMFSGGLDSCFTAWRHARKLCGRRSENVTAAVMAHGFDIPLNETGVFERAAENSRAMVASLGLELIPASCNIRDFGVDWEDAHGSALAACLQLLRGRFSTGMIAGSHVYSHLRFPWGSNPVTDPLFSCDAQRIVYDGAEHARSEKARLVADWPEAMQRLRVCWEGPQKDRNCGKCLRCVSTAFTFAAEKKPVPASLPVTSLEAGIHGLNNTVLKPVALTRMEEVLDVARRNGVDAPWVGVLQQCITHQRSLNHDKTSHPLRFKVRRWWKKFSGRI